jgi:hypothetical protein
MNSDLAAKRLGSLFILPPMAALLAVALGLASPAPAASAAPNSIRWWVSTSDLKQQLTEQPPLGWQTAIPPRGSRIEVNPAETYQSSCLSW